MCGLEWEPRVYSGGGALQLSGKALPIRSGLSIVSAIAGQSTQPHEMMTRFRAGPPGPQSPHRITPPHPHRRKPSRTNPKKPLSALTPVIISCGVLPGPLSVRTNSSIEREPGAAEFPPCTMALLVRISVHDHSTKGEGEK